MPDTTLLDCYTCPECALAVGVVLCGGEMTIEYDVAEFERRCRMPPRERGASPATCPKTQLAERLLRRP